MLWTFNDVANSYLLFPTFLSLVRVQAEKRPIPQVTVSILGPS